MDAFHDMGGSIGYIRVHISHSYVSYPVIIGLISTPEWGKAYRLNGQHLQFFVERNKHPNSQASKKHLSSVFLDVRFSVPRMS